MILSFIIFGGYVYVVYTYNKKSKTPWLPGELFTDDLALTVYMQILNKLPRWSCHTKAFRGNTNLLLASAKYIEHLISISNCISD